MSAIVPGTEESLTTADASASGAAPRWVKIAATVLAVAIVLGAGAYFALRSQAPQLDPPAQAVQSVLELRSENSTDTAAYERYIESTSVAAALAEDAAANRGKESVPDWETPRVVNSGETTASVLVKWKLTDEFQGWPTEALFMLRRIGSAWKIVDAAEQGSSEATSTP